MAVFPTNLTGSDLALRGIAVNGTILGGISTGSVTAGGFANGFHSIPVASGSHVPIAGGSGFADGKAYLSASFKGASGSIIQALNAVMTTAAGGTGDVSQKSGVTAQSGVLVQYSANKEISNTGLLFNGNILSPRVNNEVDLGSDALEFKDLYIDGTAYLDTVDIDAGNIDGTTIGGTTAAAGTFTHVSGNTLRLANNGGYASDPILRVAGNTGLSGTVTIAGDLTLSAGADGALRFTNAGENSIKIPDNQESALIIEEADNAYLTISTSNAAPLVTIGESLTVANGKTFSTNTADINGGAIDGTAIGANSANTGVFTFLTSSNFRSTAGAEFVNLGVNGTGSFTGDLTLRGGDGALRFTNAGENSIKIPDNQANALIIEEADNAYITFTSTNSSEQITVAKNTVFQGTIQGASTLSVGTNITAKKISGSATDPSTRLVGDFGTLLVEGSNSSGATKSYQLVVSGGMLQAIEQ